MADATDIAELLDAGLGAYFRPRDIAQFGISRQRLRSFVAEGLVEHVDNGLYRICAVEPTEMETLAMVAAAFPNAVICLLTALRFHDIGTQSPHEIWIALDRKARKPMHSPSTIRVVRFSGQMLTYGVVRRSALGVPFQITSPARTIVDCFRYRNKFGIDVALEALQDAFRRRIATLDEIQRAAEICRVRTVIRPYLEALTL